MGLFAKIVKGLSVINYFRNMLCLRYLTGSEYVSAISLQFPDILPQCLFFSSCDKISADFPTVTFL